MVRALGLIAVAIVAVGLALPLAAWGHATVESTVPSRGAELERAPQRVTLRFSEPVEATFGAVQVYDQAGKRVDQGGASHSGGRADEVAVGLRGGLEDGTYTATYRVVSADSHPVSGGFVFTVGRGGVPAETLDQLIDAGDAGPVTEVGFGIVRGLSYLALALAVGGIAFALVVWRPALRDRGGADESWRRASEAFAGRVGRVLSTAVALGAAMSALGIVFQGAVASGTSSWQALDPTVVGDVLGTRFGTVWGLRLVAWLALGGLLAAPFLRLGAAVLRPASLGATGLVPSRLGSPAGLVALVALLGLLCLTPALGGHASTLSPGWLLVPANVLHVLSMAIWVGGVALLLVALPAATRQLDARDRTGLIAVAVTRFSTIALFAVAGLVASGVVQAIVDIDAFSDLLHTPFGRAVLIKVGLVAILVGLGAFNRQRIRPRLAALDAAGGTPGSAGVELRRALRAEIVLMVAALGVTAALVSYAPALGQTGPFSASKTLGPARLEVTVDPAEIGPNQIHLFMFDRTTGRQFDRAKQLTVSARLPAHAIGPLSFDAQKAGPGHYVTRRADVAPAGDWTFEVTARVSAFDAYTAEVEVPIR